MYFWFKDVNMKYFPGLQKHTMHHVLQATGTCLYFNLICKTTDLMSQKKLCNLRFNIHHIIKLFQFPNCTSESFLSIRLFCFSGFIVKLSDFVLRSHFLQLWVRTDALVLTPSSPQRHNEKWLMYDSRRRWSFAGERCGVHPGTQIASSASWEKYKTTSGAESLLMFVQFESCGLKNRFLQCERIRQCILIGSLKLLLCFYLLPKDWMNNVVVLHLASQQTFEKKHHRILQLVIDTPTDQCNKIWNNKTFVK